MMSGGCHHIRSAGRFLVVFEAIDIVAFQGRGRSLKTLIDTRRG